jgi:hypothetical protein
VWRQEDDTHPHACYDGWIYLTYTVLDYDVGGEFEKIEILPCRRCQEEGLDDAS